MRPLLALTAATAQTSSRGLQAVHAVPAAHIRAQLAAVRRELGPAAQRTPVKVGMLPNAAAIEAAAAELAAWEGMRIVDPVAGPTAGGGWADAKWRQAFLRCMPRSCDLLAPNLAEARMLAGLGPRAGAGACARALRKCGFASVLITDAQPADADHAIDELHGAAHDGALILSSPRTARSGGNVRGTGCTLTAAIAAAAAWRSARGHPTPEHRPLCEAAVLGKMHASAYWQNPSMRTRPGVGFLPQVRAPWTASPPASFPQLTAALGACPITDRPAMIAAYARLGFGSAQLRIKQGDARAALQQAASASGRLRLFANDDWQGAIRLAGRGVHGVHLGQGDLPSADLAAIAKAGLRLGISAHDWFELALARSLQPSYVSLGPAFAPNSKGLPALGVGEIGRMAAARDRPATVAIGGINPRNVRRIAQLGLGGFACIGAAAAPAAAGAMLKAWRACKGCG